MLHQPTAIRHIQTLPRHADRGLLLKHNGKAHTRFILNNFEEL